MVKKNNPIWLIKNAQLDRCAQVALDKDIVKKASKNREDLKAASRFFFKKKKLQVMLMDSFNFPSSV